LRGEEQKRSIQHLGKLPGGGAENEIWRNLLGGQKKVAGQERKEEGIPKVRFVKKSLYPPTCYGNYY